MMTVDDETLQTLIETARRASEAAYCPYSRFPVGAAVLGEDGAIVGGCNVENASYGLTVCAERNAIFAAVAKGLTTIRVVVVFTPTETPTAPCGACRQVIHEFGPGAEIISVCDGPDRLRARLAELLPVAFGPRALDPVDEPKRTLS
ncbi:cytidine deaminase [Tautonia rosea]|uniref:cytidine deaminase n=1 Tax=Tautonia rosea TaxID=2728037 RepID=UPI001473E0F4|nr:cytidine deaminase [Tautonia rosea]